MTFAKLPRQSTERASDLWQATALRGRFFCLTRIFAVWTLTLLCSASHAQQACVINTADAIGCVNPQLAANAYAQAQHDPRMADPAQRKAMLENSGCGGITGEVDLQRNVNVIRHGEVPTPEGPLDIVFVRASKQVLFWIARPYLGGMCDQARDP